METLLRSITCVDLLKEINGKQDHQVSNQTSSTKCQVATPVCFDASLGIVEACLALSTHKISSAPVYDEIKGGFIGMFDFKDLLSFILKLFPGTDVATDVQFDTMEFADIVKSALTGKSNIQLKHVANLSNRNPLVTIDEQQSAYEAILLMHQKSAYRLVVFKKDIKGDNSFVSILSQSSINAYIALKMSPLNGNVRAGEEWDLGKKSILELGLISDKKMITIPTTATVFDAITLMNEKNISSVPIAEDNRGILTIIGSISISDIREVLSIKGGFKRLFQNCQTFFSSLRQHQGLDRGGNDRVPLFVVYPTTTLMSACEKIAATKAHRLWVVEGMNTLVGVVSLTDVVRMVASGCVEKQ